MVPGIQRRPPDQSRRDHRFIDRWIRPFGIRGGISRRPRAGTGLIRGLSFSCRPAGVRDGGSGVSSARARRGPIASACSRMESSRITGGYRKQRRRPGRVAHHHRALGRGTGSALWVQRCDRHPVERQTPAERRVSVEPAVDRCRRAWHNVALYTAALDGALDLVHPCRQSQPVCVRRLRRVPGLPGNHRSAGNPLGRRNAGGIGHSYHAVRGPRAVRGGNRNGLRRRNDDSSRHPAPGITTRSGRVHSGRRPLRRARKRRRRERGRPSPLLPDRHHCLKVR